MGWESLSDRHHFRRLSLFYQIKNGLSPSYLVEGIKVVPLNATKRYSNSFFPYCQKHWTTLDESIKNSSSLSIFKSSFLKTIRPPPKPYFNIGDKYGLSLLTKLRVNFSDLREHRFRHNFNCQSPVCSCQSGNECTRHFLLFCHNFRNERRILFEQLDNLSPNSTALLSTNPDKLVDIMLYGSADLDMRSNELVLVFTISFIKATKRFKWLEAFSDDFS